MNALGSGHRPGWVHPGPGIDDCPEIGGPRHSRRFGICGSFPPLFFAWFVYFAVKQEFSVLGSQLSVAAGGRVGAIAYFSAEC